MAPVRVGKVYLTLVTMPVPAALAAPAPATRWGHDDVTRSWKPLVASWEQNIIYSILAQLQLLLQLPLLGIFGLELQNYGIVK